uniref:Uncharacterized protein n=1 Tax=viral metagenome TaxID=1070528 RepID=A0A6C0KNP1_9ZZZZ
MGGRSSKDSQTLRFHLVFGKAEADRLLHESEKEDFYLEECYDHPPNAKSRGKVNYRPNSFSMYDYDTTLAYLENVIQYIPKRLVADLQTVYIVSLMPSAEDGMPHTRPGDVICFADLSQASSLHTLKHELWHIHQRKYQALWRIIFESLGWKPCTTALPSKLEEYRRFNPDTIDSPHWVFNDTWVPIPVFKDITHPKVSEVDICFYHVIEQYHTKQVPPEISTYFAGLPIVAYEHPREITAYLLAEPDKYKSSKGFRDLIKQIGQISIE